MARGDVLELHQPINSSGYHYVTPASGDEYYIFRISTSWTANTGHTIEMTPNNGSNWYTMYGAAKGQTTVSDRPHVAGFCSGKLKWYITPSVRIRFYWVGAAFWSATAVKSKD